MGFATNIGYRIKGLKQKNTKTNELSNLNYTNASILKCNTHLSGFVCKASIICSFQIYSRILIQVRHILSFLNIKKI